jgi:hypothetical protein
MTSTDPSLVWELYVAGLLLYGLAFLAVALWMRGPRTVAGPFDERRLVLAAHPRLAVPRPSHMWSVPNTRSRPTACRSARSAGRMTRRVSRRNRR